MALARGACARVLKSNINVVPLGTKAYFSNFMSNKCQFMAHVEAGVIPAAVTVNEMRRKGEAITKPMYKRNKSICSACCG